MGKEDVCVCVCVCVCVYIYMYIHIHTQWSIHNRMIISHKKKNEVLPFVTTWMDPESIMLSEISQRFTYMWNLKTKQSKKKKKKKVHRYREHQLMVARGRWWGMSQVGERDQKVQISNYKINMS